MMEPVEDDECEKLMQEYPLSIYPWKPVEIPTAITPITRPCLETQIIATPMSNLESSRTIGMPTAASIGSILIASSAERNAAMARRMGEAKTPVAHLKALETLFTNCMALKNESLVLDRQVKGNDRSLSWLNAALRSQIENGNANCKAKEFKADDSLKTQAMVDLALLSVIGPTAVALAAGGIAFAAIPIVAAAAAGGAVAATFAVQTKENHKKSNKKKKSRGKSRRNAESYPKQFDIGVEIRKGFQNWKHSLGIK